MSISDDEVEAAARAFDPFSFKSWQQSYDYEMSQSANAVEAKDFADWCMGKKIEEARTGARAALAAAAKVRALPNTGDELVARLRELLVDRVGQTFDNECHLTGEEAQELVRTITSLTARAQVAEASLASAREDALEEAATVADDHAEAWGLAMGQQAKEIATAIRALKEVQK